MPADIPFDSPRSTAAYQGHSVCGNPVHGRFARARDQPRQALTQVSSEAGYRLFARYRLQLTGRGAEMPAECPR